MIADDIKLRGMNGIELFEKLRLLAIAATIILYLRPC